MKKIDCKKALTSLPNVFALIFLLFSLSTNGNIYSGNNLPCGDLFYLTGICTNPVLPGADPVADIEKAKKEGKAVFLVITGTGVKDLTKAVSIAKAANGKMAKSMVVQINKDDASNSSLVKKLKISTVPVPFILIISPKGNAVGGYPLSEATAELLVEAVPSPKQDEVILAINEKKPVFMVVSKKGLTDKASILATCKSTSSKIASKPAIVEFDIKDSKETAFLKQIGVTAVTDKTKTIVTNSSGNITGTFEGAVTEANLTAAANKVIKKSGCCPGGSSNCGKK